MELPSVHIRKHHFNAEVITAIEDDPQRQDLWPLVYILSDEGHMLAYVGETTDAITRMRTHLRHHRRGTLTSVHLITSATFNKSATLDMESNLIRYMSGDGFFKLMNGNLGLANHNYYQKNEVYHHLFRKVWDGLRTEGITRHSLEHIDNSDLFKYSPYKNLTQEQTSGLLQLLQIMANDGVTKRLLVKGGAGTGKSILAVFLFKLLSGNTRNFNSREFGPEEEEINTLVQKIKAHHPNLKMALVVPMASFRSTMKKIFRQVDGLTASMVIGPAEVTRHEYDLVVVDEAHRLRQRVNLGTYFGQFDKRCQQLGLDSNVHNELDWVLQQSKHTVLFYDEAQSVKPSDVPSESFDRLAIESWTKVVTLKKQMRVRGGEAWVAFVQALMSGCNDFGRWDPKAYEVKLYDDLQEMVYAIRQRNDEYGLARLVAGYAWPWISKNNNALYDINIGDVKLRWNTTNMNWVNSDDARYEVGCIHTTQGYDLNYTGVIFGKEIDYDHQTHQFVIYREHYHDKNGRNGVRNDDQLRDYILNIYKTLLLRGIRGTFMYACNDGMRQWIRDHMEQPLVNVFEPRWVIPNGEPLFALPVYDLKVPAGTFGSAQQVETTRWMAWPEGIKPSADLFVCQVMGRSMDRVIPDGSWCLFRRYHSGSRNGKIMLVEHTDIQDPDLGSSYTIKEYRSQKQVTDEGWEHRRITLIPLTDTPGYLTIELEGDALINFRTVGEFVRVLN